MSGQYRDLAFASGARLVHEYRDIPPLGRADNGVGELGEVVLTKLRDRESDDPGLARTQPARREIGAVVEFGDRRAHSVAGGGRTYG